jgi:pimeloyl-ACP methyl ester carboxylesterase
MRVQIDSADRCEPIGMEARVIADFAAGLPVVEYRHVSMADDAPRPTVLCFSGGGCSGAVFALLAEKCADYGVRVVSFDMPGHTPSRLLGTATPPRAFISVVNGKVRQTISEALILRLAAEAPRLDVLSHSAGIVDVARIPSTHDDKIGRFLITGAGIPGPAAMWTALRASTFGRSSEPVSVASIFGRRQVPTGRLSDHYGPASKRTTSDSDLRDYHCAEHISLPLTLLRSRPVKGQRWRERQVILFGSAGDPISPPARLRDAAARLRSRGACVEIEILDGDLPHMFISFERAARRLAQIASHS